MDDKWTTDHTAPQETDSSNNTNNVLLPENIKKPSTPSAGILSSAAPGSTTAALAAQVPKEDSGSSDLPGAFPETPAFENTEFRVNPIPATAGIGNPVQTKPGDSVPDPSSFTGNTINSAVRLDKESYEKGSGAPILPDVVTPENERNGSGLFGLPEKSNNLIPESSLPIVGESDKATVQSSGPQSTTAALAGDVPLEPRGVPEVVKESQTEAGVDPEASADPEAVAEQSAVEKELEGKVQEEPATSESTLSGKAVGVASGAAAATTAAIAGAAAYVSSTAQDAKTKLPASTEEAKAQLPSTEAVTSKLPSTEEVKAKLPVPVQETVSKLDGTADTSATPIASTVPDVVQESITESHQSPEAAASKTAVAEKSAVEAEILKTVKPEEGTGESAPSAGTTATPIAATVPDVVQESIAESHQSPEAAASKSAVAEKSAVEAEILKTVKTEQGSGEPAPSATAATTETAPKPTVTESKPAESSSNGGLNAPAAAPATIETPKKRAESRDLSPMTRPGESSVAKQEQPTVTTGVASSSTPTKSSAVPDSPATPTSTEAKKSKRASGFFGKLKDKLSHKKEKN